MPQREATIQPASEKCLKEVASLLKKNASWKMQIEGHSDNVGAKDANLRLSQQGAEVVRAWLVAKGHGDSKPVAGNDTEEVGRRTGGWGW